MSKVQNRIIIAVLCVGLTIGILCVCFSKQIKEGFSKLGCGKSDDAKKSEAPTQPATTSSENKSEASAQPTSASAENKPETDKQASNSASSQLPPDFYDVVSDESESIEKIDEKVTKLDNDVKETILLVSDQDSKIREINEYMGKNEQSNLQRNVQAQKTQEELEKLEKRVSDLERRLGGSLFKRSRRSSPQAPSGGDAEPKQAPENNNTNTGDQQEDKSVSEGAIGTSKVTDDQSTTNDADSLPVDSQPATAPTAEESYQTAQENVATGDNPANIPAESDQTPPPLPKRRKRETKSETDASPNPQAAAESDPQAPAPIQADPANGETPASADSNSSASDNSGLTTEAQSSDNKTPQEDAAPTIAAIENQPTPQPDAPSADSADNAETAPPLPTTPAPEPGPAQDNPAPAEQPTPSPKEPEAKPTTDPTPPSVPPKPTQAPVEPKKTDPEASDKPTGDAPAKPKDVPPKP